MSDKLFSKDSNKSPAFAETLDHSDQDQEGIDYIEVLKAQGRSVEAADLAKAKVHADKHIKNVELELAELRKELDKRLSYEDLRDQIEELKQLRQNSNQSNNEQAGESGTNKEPKFEPSDIQKMIRETLEQEKSQSSKAQNIDSVKRVLSASWGRNFEAQLLQKAEALQVTPDFLEAMAGSQPKAFLSLMGVDGERQSSGASPLISTLPPRTQMEAGTSGRSPNVGKTYKDFQKIRREDPSRYRSREVQSQMHKYARELGEDFYK